MAKGIINIIASGLSYLTGLLWVRLGKRFFEWLFRKLFDDSDRVHYTSSDTVIERGIDRRENDRETLEELKRIIRNSK